MALRHGGCIVVSAPSRLQVGGSKAPDGKACGTAIQAGRSEMLTEANVIDPGLQKMKNKPPSIPGGWPAIVRRVPVRVSCGRTGVGRRRRRRAVVCGRGASQLRG